MSHEIVAVLLLIAMSASAAELPDAPSVVREPSSQTYSYTGYSDGTPSYTWKIQQPSFAERHRKAIIWGGIGIGAGIGILLGVLKHSGNCPSRIWYEGEWYPYKGSYDDQHPCPIEPPGH